MQLYLVVAGLNDFAPSVRAEPHDTIETLFERLEKKLLFHHMPPQFTAAYPLVHGRDAGLQSEDLDYVALKKGDPIVMAQYFTPAARLDPSKTVADYFGHRVAPRTVSIALTWPPESLAYVLKRRMLATHRYYQQLQAQTAQASAATRPAILAPLVRAPPPPTATTTMAAIPDCGTANEPAVELSSLLLEMTVSCLRWSTVSRWWWTTTLTNAKKHG